MKLPFGLQTPRELVKVWRTHAQGWRELGCFERAAACIDMAAVFERHGWATFWPWNYPTEIERRLRDISTAMLDEHASATPPSPPEDGTP